jgi:hypothetical protein
MEIVLKPKFILARNILVLVRLETVVSASSSHQKSELFPTYNVFDEVWSRKNQTCKVTLDPLNIPHSQDARIGPKSSSSYSQLAQEQR